MNYNKVLKYYFGIDLLKPMQKSVIDSIMSKKDTIGILPTGFGKSITFQLPAMIFDGLTIVISPLISLMQDQVINLWDKKIKAEYINSLQTIEEQNRIYKMIKKGHVKLLYVSAERLLSKKFISEISSVNISFIVCDEAHTLLWSEDFRLALGMIPKFLELLPNRVPILALTATATNNTINKIEELLKLKSPNIYIGDCDRKNIFYKIVNTKDKDRDLLFYLKNKNKVHGLIYCLTIKHVIYVYNLLKNKGYNVLMYHGQLNSNEKKNILELYKANLIDIIVSTNAFGMGIDIPDIRYVIEYDMPSCIEDYIQQSGRASRDGQYAESILLYNYKDIDTIRYFIDNIENELKTNKEIKLIKKDRYDKLESILKVINSNKCIHKELSNYFGIEYKNNCIDMCSNCKKKNDYF